MTMTIKSFKTFAFSVATLLVLAFAPLSASAQKVAIVDITQVLNTIPDYKKAQEDLEKVSSRWRSEIAQQQDQIKGLYSKFQAEQVLLTDEQRKQREEDILVKEREVREMQRAKFGPEGELFRKRQELVKPMQDKVYAAIERFAAEKGYDLILDKSSSAGIIFANNNMDKTQLVVDLLKKM